MAGTTGEQVREFVGRLVSAVADRPEDVGVSILESGTMVVVELTASRSDVGQLIGREGRMAQSLRVLVTALVTKLGKKAVLHIIEK